MGFFSKSKDYSNLTDKQLDAKFNTSKKVMLNSSSSGVDKKYLNGHIDRYGNILEEYKNR